MVVCILIQVALVIMAILSRIHFSKYKNKKIRSFPACMEEGIYSVLQNTKWVNRYRQEIRELRVLDSRDAEKETKKILMHVIEIGIVVLFASTILTELLIYKDRKEPLEKQVVVEREDYTGGTKSEDIRLTLDDKEQVYSMTIEPKEYTEKEFCAMADKQSRELSQKILGDNADFEHINSMLILPKGDADGVFAYSWISDHPEIVSSYGKVNLEEVKEDTVVTLLLKIAYQNFETEYEYPMVVVKDARGKDAFERVKEEIQKIEKETRTSDTVTLPEEYADVTIHAQRSTSDRPVLCLVFGIVIAGLLAPCTYVQLREERKKRNDVLIDQYPSFVNQLWLLLGTGMTVQMGIKKIISEMEKDLLLKKELEYAMHQLETGGEESFVYEQLGRRLHVPEYFQLMQHISQHIRMGTKDLRNLMENEMQTALKKRRESARKKGEEASTKLLFPMILLLALVMIMIVYPAMTGF